MAYEWENGDRSRKCCQTFSPLRSPAIDKCLGATECDLTELALYCKVNGVISEGAYEDTLVQAFRLVLRPRLGSRRKRVRSRCNILSHGIQGSGRTFSLRK